MDRLVHDGSLTLGGPIGDRQRVLLTIEAADEPAIRARLAAVTRGRPWGCSGSARSSRGRSGWMDGRCTRPAERGELTPAVRPGS